MIFKRKFFFLIIIFLIFTTYNPQNNNYSNSYLFPIKKIEIESKKDIDNNEIIKDLDFLKNSSLLFVNKKNIEDILLKNKFVSKIILKKIYPNILRLIIFEKEPVAVQIIEKNKYYITKKNENINFYELEIYKELPVIFGNQKDFDIYNIKAFYYFDVGRWDIMLMDERIIKLPEKNYQNILEELNSILKDNNFSKYKIFDYRINNQLILKWYITNQIL